MPEESILDLFRRSARKESIGWGRQAEVYNIDDPRFNSYLLRVRYDEGPSLEYLNSTTQLTQVANDYHGHNFGQPILNALGVSVNVKHGMSLTQTFRKNKKINQDAGITEVKAASMAYESVIDILLKLPNSAYDKIISDLDYLTKLNKGIDHHGDNIILNSKWGIGFIDTDGRVENNTSPNLYKMLTCFDSDDRCGLHKPTEKLNLLQTKLSEAEKRNKLNFKENIILHPTARTKKIDGIAVGSNTSALKIKLDEIEKSYKLQLLK